MTKDYRDVYKYPMRRIAMQGVEVIEPPNLVNGHSYQAYCRRWMAWAVSNNPESINYDDVFFLHGLAPRDEQGPGSYTNKPVIRIGSQAININKGGYIFLPVLNAFSEPIDTGVPDDPESLLNYVKADLDGTCPNASQVTITDARTSKTEQLVDDLSRYLVITDVFPLYVPALQEGARPLRTLFDVPLTTEGIRNCVEGGYHLLIKFNRVDSYYIHTYAKGRGQYQTGTFYEINVLEAPFTFNVAPAEPQVGDWTRSSIMNLATEKERIQELDAQRLKAIKSALHIGH
jgi:hypothetical protein